MFILSDQHGQVMQERSARVEAGDNQLAGEVPSLKPGLYLLSLRTADGQRQYQKLVIRP